MLMRYLQFLHTFSYGQEITGDVDVDHRSLLDHLPEIYIRDHVENDRHLQ